MWCPPLIALEGGKLKLHEIKHTDPSLSAVVQQFLLFFFGWGELQGENVFCQLTGVPPVPSSAPHSFYLFFSFIVTSRCSLSNSSLIKHTHTPTCKRTDSTEVSFDSRKRDTLLSVGIIYWQFGAFFHRLIFSFSNCEVISLKNLSDLYEHFSLFYLLSGSAEQHQACWLYTSRGWSQEASLVSRGNNGLSSISSAPFLLNLKANKSIYRSVNNMALLSPPDLLVCFN